MLSLGHLEPQDCPCPPLTIADMLTRQWLLRCCAPAPTSNLTVLVHFSLKLWSFRGLVVGCNNEQLYVSIDTEAEILIYISLSKKNFSLKLIDNAVIVKGCPFVQLIEQLGNIFFISITICPNSFSN